MYSKSLKATSFLLWAALGSGCSLSPHRANFVRSSAPPQSPDAKVERSKEAGPSVLKDPLETKPAEPSSTQSVEGSRPLLLDPDSSPVRTEQPGSEAQQQTDTDLKSVHESAADEIVVVDDTTQNLSDKVADQAEDPEDDIAQVTPTAEEAEEPPSPAPVAPEPPGLATPAAPIEHEPAQSAVTDEIHPKPESVLIVTGQGTLKVELFDDDAPVHTANFKKLAKEGFYNGLTFYRVMPGQIAFAGDPKATGARDPGSALPAEIKRKNIKGAVGAVRSTLLVNPERRSNANQFYICLVPLPQVDGECTVFGQVTAGLDVLEKIKQGSARSNGEMDPPESGEKILRIEVVKE